MIFQQYAFKHVQRIHDDYYLTITTNIFNTQGTIHKRSTFEHMNQKWLSNYTYDYKLVNNKSCYNGITV